MKKVFLYLFSNQGTYLDTSTLYNERELLDLTAGGDEGAFSRLFYLWHQKLGTYIYRLTGSTDIAKDIVQDVFMKIWTNREKLRQVECFSAYLFVVSRNHTFNCLRRIAKERAEHCRLTENFRDVNIYRNQGEVERDYYDLLDQAVEALPSQQKKVYILSRRERLKYDEIALLMDISRETVKKYLQIATHFITSYVRAHQGVISNYKCTEFGN